MIIFGGLYEDGYFCNCLIISHQSITHKAIIHYLEELGRTIENEE